MKPAGCWFALVFLVICAVSSLMFNILPGLMVEDFARRAPAARPLIAAWITAGLPEAHLYSPTDLAALPVGTAPYASGAVYTGGVVAFRGHLDPAPSAVCAMASTQLTDCFGTARGSSWNDHSGIDYGIAPDQKVTTPLGGLVSYAGPLGSYGNLVVVESGGYQVYLAHNNAVLVSAGDVVAAGQAVALSGSTGNSTGPHIHFEVRLCDPESGHCKPVNPNSVILPGAAGPCDFYFGRQAYVNWGGGEQIEFTCGVDAAGKFFIEYVCDSAVQRGMPWCW